MSGFSARWLSLRETVDHRSLNPGVLAAFSSHFADKEAVSIVDIGSGSGSSLRALAPHLGPRQKWRLVDHDVELLSFAREKLAVWADSARDEMERLVLQKDGRRIEVETKLADLATIAFSRDENAADRHSGLFEGLAEGADGVTSSAFFDLVSVQWIERFCGALADLCLPLLALLTYDGTEQWSPPHSADGPVLLAFHNDQRRDKGFGLAAGPQASDALHQALVKQSYEVFAGQSDWLLAAPDRELIHALANGSADALAQIKSISASDIASWRESRQCADSCRIGHKDIFAVPIPV